jgi:hypothetical protein
MSTRTTLFIAIIVGVFFATGVVVTGGRLPMFNHMLAQVGVVVGVAANPYNTLNEQLNQRQADIDRQAAELAAQQAALASSTAEKVNAEAPLAWYISMSLIAAAIAIILVALNFYYDWRRSK